MKCSANEVTTLASKAARGAGAPPAQATAFGAASLCHLIAGRGGIHLSAALVSGLAGPILSIPLALTRLIETVQDGVAQGPINSSAPSDLTASYLDAQLYETKWTISDGAFVATLFIARPRQLKVPPRVTLPDELATAFQSHAAKILVPETEASRRTGAGAGLTDND